MTDFLRIRLVNSIQIQKLGNQGKSFSLLRLYILKALFSPSHIWLDNPTMSFIDALHSGSRSLKL